MNDVNEAVAENLKRLREERKLSLAEAARVIGVSKSLLSQIERGEVNPTISTVWKIASGLRVSFSSLCTRPETDLEVVRAADLAPMTMFGGNFRNYPFFGFDENRRFEIYYIEMDPAASLESEPHPSGCQEFVTVFTGELNLRVGDLEITLGPAEAVRFAADRDHAYFNQGPDICRLNMVIYYP